MSWKINRYKSKNPLYGSVQKLRKVGKNKDEREENKDKLAFTILRLGDFPPWAYYFLLQPTDWFL